ncbi:MAG: hypothetical protein HYS13_23715 [Planctomycetia bacterium]|nr:hypothetical protein [Planctomycetia bacterium]
MRPSWQLTWPLLLCAFLAPRPGRADDAAKTLTDKGLVKSGSYWLAPEEAALKQKLDDVKRLEKEFTDAQKKMKAALADNAAKMAQIDKVKKELDQINTRLQNGGGQRNQLQAAATQRQQFIQQASVRVYDASRRTDNPELWQAIKDFAGAQTELGLALLAVGEAKYELATAYDKYRDDAQVASALESLGAGHRLGPGKKYDAEFKRLDKLLAQVWNDEVPVHLSNLQYRLAGVLNEKAPLTWMWVPQNDFNTLTASAAEAAGIAIPADAPQATIMFGEERKVAARQVTAPSLRFGRHVFRDVVVLVMAPEAEDMGCILGNKLFEDWKVNFLPQELRFILQPNEQSQPPQTK